MFHAKDGVYFEQQADGSVKVIVKESGMADAPTLREVVLDEGTWCSVIACMSYYGEEDYGFYRASHFHNGTPIGPTTPIKDKPRKWEAK